MADYSQYLIPADLNSLRCVDERVAPDQTNGIQLPGGVYGILDAVKSLKTLSETAAREQILKAGINPDAHVDDHHGALGCGYGKLVETKPASVIAREGVPAADRFAWAEAHSGKILHYTGEHKPTGAVINYRTGTTIDSKTAMQAGNGVFNCDAWALGELAGKLGLDPVLFTNHVVDVYKKTVTALTGIADFPELK